LSPAGFSAAPAIATFGARFERGNLLLPMFDAQGKLWSVQEIAANGDKKFMPGGRKQGCMAWIGYPRDGQPIALVEGFATGATVHQALGCAVAVAFDAGNLEPVVREVKRAYPQSALAILGDNDRSLVAAGKVNKGVESARAAAMAVEASWAVPHFEVGDPLSLSDWNDLATAHGMAQAQSQMSERLPPEFAPNRTRTKARAPQSAPTPTPTPTPAESTPSRQTPTIAAAAPPTPSRAPRAPAHSFAR
jgi:putative DNA primase/helicase